MPPTPRLALLYVGFAAVLWGVLGALARLVGWDPVATTAVSSLFAVVLLLLWLIPRRELEFSRPILQSVNAVFVAASFTMFLLAFQYTLVSRAQALNFVHPATTLIFAALYKRTLPPISEILLCVLGLAGVALIAAEGTWEGGVCGGDILSIAAGMCFSVSCVMQPSLGSRRSLTATLIAMVGSTLVLLAWCMIAAPAPLPTLTQTATLLAVSLAVALPTLFFCYGAPHVKPSLAGMMITIELPVGVLAGVLMFGERPSCLAYAGMVLIALCAFAIARRANST